LFGRACGFGGVDRRCPAAEELECLFGAGAGFGGVGEEREPLVSGEFEPVEAEAELADRASDGRHWSGERSCSVVVVAPGPSGGCEFALGVSVLR
jgi:hypothetical protein